jgi:cyclopropane fatty-acyl-phospholipid synthase-like methyltransferase
MSGDRGYRGFFYREYASAIQDQPTQFDAAAARHWARPYSRYLRGWLPADRGSAILDLGCGSGKFLHWLAGQGYLNLSGIDVSASQVALARQAVQNVFEGDAIGFLREKTEHFDVIVGLDVIEHFDKEEVIDALQACHGALRAGGRLILQTPNADNPFVAGVRYGDFSHETCFGPASLGRILSLCGFRSVEVRECGPVVRGPGSLVQWMLWRFVRQCFRLVNVIETSYPGAGVLTRVMVISGVKPLGGG